MEFRWRESPSSSSGSAESIASDRALLDLDMVGNVKTVTLSNILVKHVVLHVVETQTAKEVLLLVFFWKNFGFL